MFSVRKSFLLKLGLSMPTVSCILIEYIVHHLLCTMKIYIEFNQRNEKKKDEIMVYLKHKIKAIKFTKCTWRTFLFINLRPSDSGFRDIFFLFSSILGQLISVLQIYCNSQIIKQRKSVGWKTNLQKTRKTNSLPLNGFKCLPIEINL